MPPPAPPIPRHALPALAVLAFGALGMAAVGAAITRQFSHFYLVFNLALGSVPLAFAMAMAHLASRGRSKAALAAGAGWLLFLPNAPYILTDYIHLRWTPNAWTWGHIVLLAWFSFTSLTAGLLSIRLVHHVVETRWGWRVGWAFALGTAALSGVGVALGRLQRWNSWDLFLHPRSVLTDALRHVPIGTRPVDAVLPAGLGLFIAAAYFLVRSLTPPTPSAVPSPSPSPALPSIDSPAQLLSRIRWALGLFIAGLVLSGLTAIPLEAEVAALRRWAGASVAFPAAATWLQRVGTALSEVGIRYPFLAYGTDWLAFGHLAIAIAFVPAWRDPVRHRWLFGYGLLLCALVIPWALAFGSLRGIPAWWRAIDCAFGIGGALPLFAARAWSSRLAATESRALPPPDPAAPR